MVEGGTVIPYGVKEQQEANEQEGRNDGTLNEEKATTLEGMKRQREK
jgi:hypothetical protein